MGRLRAWIEEKLSAAAAPTKPAASKFGHEDRAHKDAEKARDYDMQVAVERERSRRSSF